MYITQTHVYHTHACTYKQDLSFTRIRPCCVTSMQEICFKTKLSASYLADRIRLKYHLHDYIYIWLTKLHALYVPDFLLLLSEQSNVNPCLSHAPSAHHTHFLKIESNISQLFTSRSSKWSSHFWFPGQNFVLIPQASNA